MMVFMHRDSTNHNTIILTSCFCSNTAFLLAEGLGRPSVGGCGGWYMYMYVSVCKCGMVSVERTNGIASFPGPAHLSITCSKEKWRGPSIFPHVMI